MTGQTSIFKTREGKAKCLGTYERVLANWPVAFEEQDLPTRFGTTHLVVSGRAEGKPLILLHGQDSSATSWIYNIADLSQIFRTHAVDTIGDMGKSKPSCLPKSRQDYAEWLLEVLEQLRIQKADFVGLSYGGFLATNFALARSRTRGSSGVACSWDSELWSANPPMGKLWDADDASAFSLYGQTIYRWNFHKRLFKG